MRYKDPEVQAWLRQYVVAARAGLVSCKSLKDKVLRLIRFTDGLHVNFLMEILDIKTSHPTASLRSALRRLRREGKIEGYGLGNNGSWHPIRNQVQEGGGK